MITFKAYSEYYDSLYKDKDYRKEVDFLIKALNEYSSFPPKKILSLGCGTATYEIILAKKGFRILGIDISRGMLRIAKQKIIKNGLEDKIRLVRKNVAGFDMRQEFDSCIAMFNVVGYQTMTDQLSRMFKSVGNNLKKGGLFMFDCWDKVAVLKDRPVNKIKEIKVGNKKIVRLTRSKVFQKKSLLEINFEVLEIKGEKILSETKETHLMRYWFLSQLENLLEKNNFSLIKSCNFLDLKSKVSGDNWNIFIVARKNI